MVVAHHAMARLAPKVIRNIVMVGPKKRNGNGQPKSRTQLVKRLFLVSGSAPDH